MSLPWISRAAHEQVVAVWQAAFEQAGTREMAAHEAYRDLLDKYHDLMQRRANAASLPAAVIVEPDVDLVMQAASERWGSDPMSLPHVLKYVRDQRKKAQDGAPDAMDEGDLLNAVMFGISENDGVHA